LVCFDLKYIFVCFLSKVSDIFKEIDEKPIGTASLAQCHRAVLKDGTVVAVKIQHPKVKTNSVADIKTMLVGLFFYISLKILLFLFKK
jgi:predicted unusual protein kinase regulating ubiquinone biosynthesis (AarF/ABC1/UbiB family)